MALHSALFGSRRDGPIVRAVWFIDSFVDKQWKFKIQKNKVPSRDTLYGYPLPGYQLKTCTPDDTVHCHMMCVLKRKRPTLSRRLSATAVIPFLKTLSFWFSFGIPLSVGNGTSESEDQELSATATPNQIISTMSNPVITRPCCYSRRDMKERGMDVLPGGWPCEGAWSSPLPSAPPRRPSMTPWQGHLWFY